VNTPDSTSTTAAGADSPAAALRAAAAVLATGLDDVPGDMLTTPLWDHIACHTAGPIPAVVMHPGIRRFLADLVTRHAETAGRIGEESPDEALPHDVRDTVNMARLLLDPRHAAALETEAAASESRPRGDTAPGAEEPVEVVL